MLPLRGFLGNYFFALKLDPFLIIISTISVVSTEAKKQQVKLFISDDGKVSAKDQKLHACRIYGAEWFFN